MIDNIFIHETQNTYPYYNLAMEEYFTLHVKSGECVLFLWQNDPSVIIGRNQNIYVECDTNSLKKDGIYPVRRLSGGGAVYHDHGNLNFTFCVRRRDFDPFLQSKVILNAVKRLGIGAELSGRNDLTVMGRKFSGHAFYKTGDHCYHHGTILINADMSKMMRYLTPDREKLAAKGVSSVKSRVINLADISTGIDKDTLCKSLKDSFSEIYGMEAAAISGESIDKDCLKASEKKFLSPDFIFGADVSFDHKIKKKFEWGIIEILLSIKDGTISNAKVLSDCMDTQFPNLLGNALKGCSYDEKAILSAVSGLNEKITDEDRFFGANMKKAVNDIYELFKNLSY